MSSLPAASAKANSIVSKDVLQDAANARFVADVDSAIQEAIKQGKFQISVLAWEKIDVHEVYKYYRALGYAVGFPDLPRDTFFDPSGMFFGPFWSAYWADSIWPHHVSKKPLRWIFFWGAGDYHYPW